VIGIVTKWKWADGNIVQETVPHFISIFDVKVGTTNIVQHVPLNLGMVCVMNDDSTLLRILDSIVLEDTIVAFSHFVKMQTVLPLDPCVQKQVDEVRYYI